MSILDLLGIVGVIVVAVALMNLLSPVRRRERVVRRRLKEEVTDQHFAPLRPHVTSEPHPPLSAWKTLIAALDAKEAPPEPDPRRRYGPAVTGSDKP